MSTAHQSPIRGTASSATRPDRLLVVQRRREELGGVGEELTVLAGPARLRDVDDRGDARDDAAFAIEDRAGALGDPGPRPVGADQLDLGVGDGLALDRPGERPVLRQQLAAVGVEALVGLAARDVVDLARRHPEDLLEPIVGEDDPAARGLGDHQAFRQLLEERLEAGSLRLEVGDEPLADAGERDPGEGLGAEVGVRADERAVVRVERPGAPRTTGRGRRTWCRRRRAEPRRATGSATA